MSTWTPELKEKVIKMYTEAEPTPESSVEILSDIAEELEQSVNGIRMVLIQAGVYVKKDAPGGKAAGGATKSGDAPKRVSKETSIAELTKAITDIGAPVDEDILSKLTGKAAVYFLSVLNKR